MKAVKKILAPALLALWCVSAGAFPPFVPLEDRVAQADIVLLGELIRVDKGSHTSATRIVQLRIQPLEVWKGRLAKRPFTLTLLVFPGSLENKLTSAPRKGRYIFFLNRKKVQDSRGNPGRALVFWEPRVYAYEEATEATIRKIKLMLR